MPYCTKPSIIDRLTIELNDKRPIHERIQIVEEPKQESKPIVKLYFRFAPKYHLKSDVLKRDWVGKLVNYDKGTAGAVQSNKNDSDLSSKSSKHRLAEASKNTHKGLAEAASKNTRKDLAEAALKNTRKGLAEAQGYRSSFLEHLSSYKKKCYNCTSTKHYTRDCVWPKGHFNCKKCGRRGHGHRCTIRPHNPRTGPNSLKKF
jgi:hypothetical protein